MAPTTHHRWTGRPALSWLVTVLLCTPAIAAAQADVALGVLVVPTKAYSVDYVPGNYAPENAIITGLTGLPASGQGFADKHHADKQYAKILNHPENALPQMSEWASRDITRQLGELDPVLKPVALPSSMLAWGKPVFSRVRKESVSHALVLRPHGNLRLFDDLSTTEERHDDRRQDGAARAA